MREEPRDPEAEVEAEAEPVAEPVVPEATPEQLEQAERLIPQIQLARMRNQPAVTEKLLTEALALAPRSPEVIEALGDDYVWRRQWGKAKDAYKKAHELAPTNSRIEGKYGEMVLKVDLAIDPLSISQADAGTMASTKTALLLNIMLPGLGHAFFLDQPVKGGILFLTWLIGGIWVFVMPRGLEGLFSLFVGRGAPFQPVILLPLFMMVGAFLYSVATASAESKRWRVQQIERPVPPDNRDFEL